MRDHSKGSSGDRAYVSRTRSPPGSSYTTLVDTTVALPGISDPTIRLALEALKREGKVAAEGPGRSAVWRNSRL